jgi:hypothetical protein
MTSFECLKVEVRLLASSSGDNWYTDGSELCHTVTAALAVVLLADALVSCGLFLRCFRSTSCPLVTRSPEFFEVACTLGYAFPPPPPLVNLQNQHLRPELYLGLAILGVRIRIRGRRDVL